jgi:K+-sensing histidine kinase KdpD
MSAALAIKGREVSVRMLGHDLRDPLNAIVFNAQLLINQAERRHPSDQRHAARIVAGARWIERILCELARCRK